jgi:hypothetical protein
MVSTTPQGRFGIQSAAMELAALCTVEVPGWLIPEPETLVFLHHGDLPDVPRPLGIENLGLGPDLMLGGFALTYGTAQDVRIGIAGTVINIGTEGAETSLVSVYLSQDTTIGADDVLLQSFQVGPIASGNLIDFESLIDLPSAVPSGAPFFIGLRIDSTNAVVEVDETNNTTLGQLFQPNPAIGVVAPVHVEPYVLLLRDDRNLNETGDLAALGPELRIAEALSPTELNALRTDLGRAGISTYEDVPVFQFQALPALLNGSVDALVLYRDSALLDPLPSGVSVFEIPGKPGDLVPFDAAINMILGGGGDDTLFATTANDLIIGGGGRDTAAFEGPQSSYTLTLTPSGMTLRDRRDDAGQFDTLVSIETLDFGIESAAFNNQPMALDLFSGPTRLTATDFRLIAELYIAYFNRAPDAIGLYFWGTLFEKGFTLEQMAASFFDQQETRATYAAVIDHNGGLIDADAFVTAVYANVLGRAPDADGFAFWTTQLNNNPDITPPTFILSIINGAKFAADPVPQTFVDQAYLATKTEIGAYYSVIKGLSDVADARSLMQAFDGSSQSISAAVDLADMFHLAASDPLTGDFIFPLVGVIYDPFAIF